MNDTTDRIAQFENMAAADPTNDMAHFSLGNAYLEAGRAAEAAAAFEKCCELNPSMSKAFERCGAAMIKAGWEDRAAAMLEAGYRTASERGDRMPLEAMGHMLDTLGRGRPDVTAAKPDQPTTDGDGMSCLRTGQQGTSLDGPPFRGPLGEWIAANITAETWDAWIHQGTKVINELRLDLSKSEDAAMYDQHMCEYLDVPADVRPS